MTEPLLPQVESLEEELDDLKGGRSALADLVRREHDLREQARTVASRDWELSAARQELRQHERGLSDEIEALIADQLDLAARQERRAETLLAALRERSAELDDREQRGARIAAASAALERREHEMAAREQEARELAEEQTATAAL